MNKAISSIKDTIKQQVEGSREIRKQIHAASGMDRWHLWNEKRYHGDTTRYWLLAYACLRGRPYATVEIKCAEGNEPSPTRLLDCIQAVLPQEGPEKAEWTKERVKAWLTRSEPSVAAPAAGEKAA